VEGFATQLSGQPISMAAGAAIVIPADRIAGAMAARGRIALLKRLSQVGGGAVVQPPARRASCGSRRRSLPARTACSGPPESRRGRPVACRRRIAAGHLAVGIVAAATRYSVGRCDVAVLR
jgi:hypothetical protein